MEEFRPYIVDQIVLSAARARVLTAAHSRVDEEKSGVLLTKAGREALLGAYESRMLTRTKGATPDFAGTIRRHLYLQATRLGDAIADPNRTWEGLAWR